MGTLEFRIRGIGFNRRDSHVRFVTVPSELIPVNLPLSLVSLAERLSRTPSAPTNSSPRVGRQTEDPPEEPCSITVHHFSLRYSSPFLSQWTPPPRAEFPHAIYSISRSHSTLRSRISRNYSFDQTKSVHDAPHRGRTHTHTYEDPFFTHP